MDYAVGVPAAVSADPGSVNDDAVAPPQLDFDVASNRRVAAGSKIDGPSATMRSIETGSETATESSPSHRMSIRFKDAAKPDLAGPRQDATEPPEIAQIDVTQIDLAEFDSINQSGPSDSAAQQTPSPGERGLDIDSDELMTALDALADMTEPGQTDGRKSNIVAPASSPVVKPISKVSAFELPEMDDREPVASPVDPPSLAEAGFTLPDSQTDRSASAISNDQDGSITNDSAVNGSAVNGSAVGVSPVAEVAKTSSQNGEGSTDTAAENTAAENNAGNEKNPGNNNAGDYANWQPPSLTLVVTGNQHGYIEPCGCTGLDRQKGGVARRFTFIDSLRDRGWQVAPIDAGNQVRRFGAQPEIKLQQTVDALIQMQYAAVGIGPDDAKLGIGPMLAVAAADDTSPFHSANVVLFDESMMASHRMIDRGNIRVGVTSVLDPASIDGKLAEEITLKPLVQSATAALAAMNNENANFRVLMFFGKEDDARKLIRSVSGYDLVVVSGGYGEPTFEPMTIEDSPTQMIVTGNKGMYAGLIGLDPLDTADTKSSLSMRYSRVALTDRFEDAPQMRALMGDYQEQLRQVGLEGLGLLPPIPHSSGDAFVGSATCGKCHTTAMDIWENSMHALATEHIVHPPSERGDVARHFDPECISCHVTGWNPQEYYPYKTGYLDLNVSNHLTGNGCENCHGPGAAHSAAEEDGSNVSQAERLALRDAIRLPLEQAREKCMQCHDLDNSPDFHETDAFEDIYWPEVEHYGVD